MGVAGTFEICNACELKSLRTICLVVYTLIVCFDNTQIWILHAANGDSSDMYFAWVPFRGRCYIVYTQCPATYRFNNSNLVGKYCACICNFRNRQFSTAFFFFFYENFAVQARIHKQHRANKIVYPNYNVYNDKLCLKLLNEETEQRNQVMSSRQILTEVKKNSYKHQSVQMAPEVEGIWGCVLQWCWESQCPVENT